MSSLAHQRHLGRVASGHGVGEPLEGLLRGFQVVQGEGVPEDVRLGSPGDVGLPLHGLPGDLFEGFLVNLPADPAGVDQRVVDIPEDEPLVCQRDAPDPDATITRA
jgi:hypothetical protein